MNFILNIIFVVLLVFVGYVFYHPVLIRNILRKHWNISPDKDSLMHDNVTEENFNVTIENNKTFKQKIYYYSKPGNQTNKLIIDIPGGGFLVAATNLNIYFNMANLDIDVVSIAYPVPMEAQAKHTILYLEEAIQYIIEKYEKKYTTSKNDKSVFEVYLVTASSGSYYGAKLINRAKFKKHITKFVGISGYYGHKSVSNEFLKFDRKMLFN